ncbi:MAG: radical SAM protein [Pseudobutyrivibrio ruminis]|nr:radical SAM protein [Pseudobutyrivibrio ruminis]
MSENDLRNEPFKVTVARYPQLPYLNLLKTDVQRRGVNYTDTVIENINQEKYQITGSNVFFSTLGARDDKNKFGVPEALVLRDGSIVITDPTPLEQNPYIVDYIDGKYVLIDAGEIVEEVDFWEKPSFYGKKTSKGTPMDSIIFARPQRLNITPTSPCYFFSSGLPCKYCDLNPHICCDGVTQQKMDPEDAYETVREAIKQEGRFTTLCMTMGSDIGGEKPFDDELNYYIDVLKAIGKNFEGRFPSQAITTALTKEQLQRLHDETGLMSYTSDIEVLNEEKFNWICPGKAKYIGYQEWKKRLIDAVDVFGRGNVGTGIVGGVELAQPDGFATEDEALESTLAEAETLISKGVAVVYIVWVPRPHSVFKKQHNASLDYYARLTLGLDELSRKYGVRAEFDDYRRCGNHPNSDLQRIS